MCFIEAFYDANDIIHHMQDMFHVLQYFYAWK